MNDETPKATSGPASVTLAKETTSVPLLLLIEDSADDVFFFRRALSKLDYHCDVRVVSSVSGAKQYMLNEGEFANAAYFRKPTLIVADFWLGGQTSLGFVQWLRAQETLRDTPVVMLSGVVSGLDPVLFAGLAVNSFLRKPGDLNELTATLRPVLPQM